MKEKDLKEHLANTLAWLRLERDENPDFISNDALQFIAANMIGALNWADKTFDEQEFIAGVNREYDREAQ